MNKEKLEKEHAELKERLAELVDFINSKEFFELNDVEKQIVSTQRSGMEIYVSALGLRLWGENARDASFPSMLPMLMSTMLIPTLSSTSSSATYLNDALQKDGEKQKGD